MAAEKGSVYGDLSTDGQTHTRVSFPCERHSNRESVKFCGDHDSALCTECASTLHRTCKDVESVEDISGRELKGKQFKQFKSDLDNVVKKVNRLKKIKNEDLSKVRTETTEALNSITEFRKDINYYLDKLETKGKSYLEKRYKEIHAIIQEDIDECEHSLHELDKLKKKLESLDLKSQRFMNIKLGSSILAKAQRLCKEMKEYRSKSEFVKMSIDPAVKTFVMNLRWYGKHRTYLSMRAPPALPHLYKVKQDSFFDIRCKLDRKVCAIVDSCQVEDGTILLLDSVNRNIKQIDVSHKIVDYLDLPGEPRALCRQSSGGAVVLVTDGTRSNVYNVIASSAKLTLSDNIQLPELYRGIAEYDGTIYVNTKTTVSSYSATGEPLCVVYTDSSGSIEKLHVDADGTKLYISDTIKGVVILDLQEEDVNTLNDLNAKNISNVCLDVCNQLFVCGYDSNNVVQCGRDGQRLGELITKKDITAPLSLCFDKITNRLVVSQKSKNFIKVFQLK